MIKEFFMGYRERYRHMRRLGYDPARARRGAKGGCYIATAVYGSYDCPQVWTLRRFRDLKLSASFLGRTFIKIYYFVSPALVKVFGKNKLFKHFWKNILDKIVQSLQNKGYSNLPYKDNTKSESIK